jgi:hypothetical protein
MTRQLIVGGTLVVICMVSMVRSEEFKLKRGTVCWPLNFSGVTLGVTSDSEVERLLGKGIARKNEGDTGGRYFVDEGHTATLHVVSFTDSIVGELTLQKGVDHTIHASELKQAQSKWFKPADGFGNWHALHLGSSRDEVLKNLGEPKKRIATNDWRYETICECELPEYFDMFFKDNTLVKVVFSAPAG